MYLPPQFTKGAPIIPLTSKGNITKLAVDAIVNAANRGLRGEPIVSDSSYSCFNK